RLDKDTSGLIVFAKNDRAMVYLQQQFKSREVSKEYLVLVRGQLSPSIGVITGPVGRDPAHRQRMAVVATGREARTSYRVLEYMKGYTFLEVRPETGRTHQIRVHLSAAGYPVAGDDLYGGADRLAKRQFIHARALSFRLLSTGESRKFEAELPPDLKEVLGRLSSPGAR
ncbi:MAG: pseudouridine synthase, partial [Dehalococcoidia bacterium]|nr:pseudouridine synthase [Dehalococcoidia bacterium]